MPELSRPLIFASLAVIVSIIRYATYIISISRGETKPHVFSWLIWGVMVGMGAVAQLELGGGASAWVLVLVSASCLCIAVLALFVGEKTITRTDWAALIATVVIIAVWKLTANPVIAIVCIVATDLFSYWPTVRKSWTNPWDEPPKSYFWAGLRYFLTLFAVPRFTLEDMAYPFFLMATDWGFMVFVIWRRRVLRAHT